MVNSGEYTVELVRAEDGASFKEHTGPSNNEVYVEVEPDCEYFIQVKNNSNDRILVRYKVDGTKLPCVSDLSSARSTKVGILSFEDGYQIDTALRFHKKESAEATATGEPWIGFAEITIAEAIACGVVETPRNYEGEFDCAEVDGFISEALKKVVQTSVGESSIKGEKRSTRRIKYRAGEHLTTIKLNYCTAAGLVEVGVLPRPPHWELHRMRNPRDADDPNYKRKLTPSLMDCLSVEPAMIVTTPANDALGIQQVMTAVFDLCEADKSGDEEENATNSAVAVTPENRKSRTQEAATSLVAPATRRKLA